MLKCSFVQVKMVLYERFNMHNTYNIDLQPELHRLDTDTDKNLHRQIRSLRTKQGWDRMDHQGILQLNKKKFHYCDCSN